MGRGTKSESTLEELADRLGGKIFHASQVSPEGISIDTRTLEAGNIYIAIRGKNLDGHSFLNEARQKGACAFVVRKGRESECKDFPNVIVVPDTTQALQNLARSLRKDFKGPCVGITGSSGKTTTKEITRAFLSSEYRVLASEGNKNNYIGLPLTLVKLEPVHEAILAELGASYPGEIGELCHILLPDLGIITNVYPCHLEGFGSLDSIYQTKIQLADSVLASGGTIVIPGDDQNLLSRVSSRVQKGKVVTFGLNPHCDYFISAKKVSASGIEFEVNQKFVFRLGNRGQFNVLNALAAITLARTLGFEMSKLAAILESFQFPKSRFEVITTSQGVRIIDDSYNSNPTALRLAIESFEEMKTDGRKVLVCADMLELGERAKEFHRSLGEGIARKALDVVVTVGPLMKSFLDGIHSVLDHAMVTYGFDANSEAKEFLENFLKSGDLVLFKGSRSMKLEEIIQCFMPSYIR